MLKPEHFAAKSNSMGVLGGDEDSYHGKNIHCIHLIINDNSLWCIKHNIEKQVNFDAESIRKGDLKNIPTRVI